MDLDGLAFDQHRLEPLNAKAMERPSAVEETRMLFDDVLERFTHFVGRQLDQFLSSLDGADELLLFELVIDELLEELECQLLRQSALMKGHLRTKNNRR